MRARRTLTVVGCHAGGEVGDVITGGVLPPRGASVFEQMQTLQREDDWLRRMLLREPRGSVARHVNLVVPATRADCDAGFIIMEPTEYPPMSGSNTICTTTVLLETGMVEMVEPETVVRLEAPGGVVEARAVCRDGRCESVEFTNVPCFADQLDAPARGRGSRNRLGGCRVRGHVVRDRRRALARLLDRAARGSRSLRRGRADPRCRARAAVMHPPGEPGHLGRQHRADRGAVAGRRQGDAQRGDRGTRSARPLGDRDRAVGAALGAARAGTHAGRRRDVARVCDRLDLRRADRARGAGGDARRHRPGDPRQRVDHRHLAVLRRRLRSLPRGLPARGHVGRQRTRLAVLAPYELASTSIGGQVQTRLRSP